MDAFIDRLTAALDDPRTDLVLVIGLWLPTTFVLIAVVVAVVLLLRLIVRTAEPADS